MLGMDNCVPIPGCKLRVLVPSAAPGWRSCAGRTENACTPQSAGTWERMDKESVPFTCQVDLLAHSLLVYPLPFWLVLLWLHDPLT